MARPSQEFPLPEGSRESAWALDPILNKRLEAPKAPPHPAARCLCSDSELSVIPHHSHLPQCHFLPIPCKVLGSPLLFSHLCLKIPPSFSCGTLVLSPERDREHPVSVAAFPFTIWVMFRMYESNAQG